MADWGCHQRFFRQLCMAMKLPRLVEIAKEALADNKCVVIGLQTTGEARLTEAVRCASLPLRHCASADRADRARRSRREESWTSSRG